MAASSLAAPTFDVCKMCGGAVDNEATHEDLVKCQECGLVFAATRHSDEHLAEIYQQLYSRAGAYSPHLAELDRLRRNEAVPLGWNRETLLKALLQRGASDFAELGAGVGVVAFRVQKLPVSYIGYEPQPETAQAAKEAGLAIRQGGWQELLASEGEGSKDAVVAFEVLEHVQELKETLGGLHCLLRTGGHLAFSVPNYDRRLDFEPADRLHQDAPPIHVNFWNPGALAATLELAGFEVSMLRVRRRPYFEPSQLIKRLPLYWRWLRGQLHGPTILAVAQKR